MLYISLVFSAVLFALTYGVVAGSTNRPRAYLTVWYGLLFGIVPVLCIFLPTYLLHAFLLGIVAMTCRWFAAGLRAFALSSLAAFVVSYAVVGVPRAMELRQAVRQNPLESIDERLAYETSQSDRQKNAPHLNLLYAADDELDQSLYQSTGDRRGWVLKELHEGSIRLFVNAPGFGVIRMIGPGLRDVSRADDIRNAPILDVPETVQPGDSPAISTGDLILEPSKGSGLPQIGSRELHRYHRGSVREFANPLGFGYVRDREHVAGFVSHRFTQFPWKPDAAKGEGHWRLESLELISLLKHPEPVAYVSKHLPRMDELRDAPTRPLDEFETEHLAKLRNGDELSAGHAPRRVRMLGAIRAGAACVKCHTVDQGDLLGAFSYDLRRDIPINP